MDADALLYEVRVLVNDFISTVAIWTYLCEVPVIGAFDCHTVEHEKFVYIHFVFLICSCRYAQCLRDSRLGTYMFTNSEVISDNAVRDLAAYVRHARTIDDVLEQLLQGVFTSNHHLLKTFFVVLDSMNGHMFAQREYIPFARQKYLSFARQEYLPSCVLEWTKLIQCPMCRQRKRNDMKPPRLCTCQCNALLQQCIGEYTDLTTLVDWDEVMRE